MLEDPSVSLAALIQQYSGLFAITTCLCIRVPLHSMSASQDGVLCRLSPSWIIWLLSSSAWRMPWNAFGSSRCGELMLTAGPLCCKGLMGQKIMVVAGVPKVFDLCTRIFHRWAAALCAAFAE